MNYLEFRTARTGIQSCIMYSVPLNRYEIDDCLIIEPDDLVKSRNYHELGLFDD
jgi:hypothetical protein